MKSFLLNSLLLFLLACSRPPQVNTPPQEIASPTKLVSPFRNGASSYFFKTQSDIYGHYLSGLLLIKPLEGSSYRIVFTTEVGIKLFDFEISSDSFQVHYCIDKLRRKPVLKILEKDFRLMLMNDLPVYPLSVQEGDKWTIFSQKKKKENFFYFVSKKEEQLQKIEVTSSKGKQKVLVEEKDYNNNFPGTIKITHNNIKLTIELRLIER